MLSFLHDGIAAIEPYVRHYGEPVLFVIIALEALGAPLPGESALVASALLAARGDFSLWSVLAVVWAGAVIGDSTGYAIGRFGGRRLVLRFGAWVGLTPERLARIEALFRRRGWAIVLVARFVVVLRQLNGLTAGIVAMPWPRFLAANMAGAALWTGAWGLAAYFFGDLLGLA